MDNILDKYHKWKYKNTGLLILSLVLLFLFANHPFSQSLINKIGQLGYFGIFITGLFFVSTFTVAPASVVLFMLSGQFNPLTIALIAGLGATFGDLLILKFLKNKVFEELYPLYQKIAGKRVRRLFKTPYFAWLPILAGILIIASPFPDEIGIGLLGISKLKIWQFFIITFACNTLGIFIIISLAKAV